MLAHSSEAAPAPRLAGGGRQCLVIDLIQLRQGAKQLVFESGELLTLHSRSRMIAMRMLRRW